MLKTDITHFFDNISWNILREKLYRTIKEEDVLELIRLNACTAILDEETGEISGKDSRRFIRVSNSSNPFQYFFDGF